MFCPGAAERFVSVTVIHADSGLADALSTALFILPIDRGRAIAEGFGAEVIWIGLNGDEVKIGHSGD